MNFQNDKMGRLEGTLEITEHPGFQTVSYKVLGFTDTLRDSEQFSVKAPRTPCLQQADPGRGQ